jgi:DNA-binding XRE family transcriptional regulator
MQEFDLSNIRRVLFFGPVHIKVPRPHYPPHWRSGQRPFGPPESLGFQLRRRRLELHLLQADVAAALGVHTVSISNWERGVSQPSRQVRKQIREFLGLGSTVT